MDAQRPCNDDIAPDSKPCSALDVGLASVHPSATNPRKHFDQAALDELAESIRTHGILQPILVRPLKGNGHASYEIVAGERRYRAAAKIGLATIPVLVRHLGDAQALELQLLENLQRTDLHPLEEAEGYELLQRQHKYTTEDLAKVLGKSKAYVYARLKLLALAPKAREAFFCKGTLAPSTALLLARIPVPDLQLKALADITTPRYREPLSVREAAAHIQEHYMLRLSDAPFPCDDATLLAGVGPCPTCPHRTGNQRELFSDVKSADVCTDPTCYARKRDAAQARERTRAELAGQRVIVGKEARTIKPHEYSDELRGYVRLSERCHADPKGRTYQALLGARAAQGCVMLEDPHTKDLLPVVSTSDATKALKEKGYAWALAARSVSTNTWSSEQRKREEKARTETTIRQCIHEAIRQKAGSTLSLDDLRLIAASWFEEIWDEHRKHIMALWAWPEDKRAGRTTTARAHIAALNTADIQRFLIDLAVIGDTRCPAYGDGTPTTLLAMAKRYRIDAEKIRKRVLDEARAKTAAKAAKNAKPSATRAAQH